MAVKFSQFTEEAGAANVTRLVGFTATGNLNIQIPPANIDTLVTSNTAQSGTSATYTLSGTKTGTATTTDLTTYTVPANSGMALTAGTNTIAFDATSYKLTSTNTSPAGTVPLVLTGTGGGDAGLDTVNLVGTGTVGITSSGNTITINGSAAAGSVTSFTNANGTYVSAATVNTAATGAITTGIIDLSAVDGTSNVTTRFLSKDNTWDVPTYTVDSTYTLPITGSSGAVTATLTGSGGDTDPVLITAGTNVAFSSITAAGFTIDAAGGGGGGTVTSIGMTVPAAFAVTPASITTSGTFAISGAGTASQVVLGNGTLGTLPTDTNTTYDLTSQASGTSVDVNLVPSTGTTDTIKLTPAGGLTITKSGDVITLDTSASGTGTVTNVSSATPSLISVASQASTPAITAITSGGVGASSTSLATGAQIQAAINTAVAGLLDYKGGYNALTNSPDLDSGSNIAILKGDAYTVTVAGTFFTEAVGIGDLLIANDDMLANGGSALTKWTTVQNNIGTAQVGATDGATAKGLAGFDNQMFATTANGFITSTTLNTVVITRVGAGNGLFYVDGTQQADITLMPDVTYLIDQSDASNDGHPLILSTTTPSLAEYATGVVYLIDNVPVANAAAYNTAFNGATTSRQLRVTLNQVAPTLYYVCYNHQNMGGNISEGGDYVSWNLTGDAGTTEAIANGNTVDIAGGTDISTIASSTDRLTVNHAAISRTNTTSTNAPAAGASVDLIKTIGVSPQGHVTAIDVSTVTWPAAGVPVKTVNTFPISGTSTNTLIVTSPTNPSSVNFIDVYINGVYQAKANATLSVKTLTLANGFYPDGAIIETVTTT